MPYYPFEKNSDDKAYFINSTQEEKTVSGYTKLNFIEIDELDVFIYWRYLRDAVIWNLNQTEKGKDYLKKAYNYTKNKNVDKADRNAIADFLAEGVKANGK